MNVGEVVELDRVGLRIEVDDGVGADAGIEYESVVARAAIETGTGWRNSVAGGSVMSVPPFPSDAKLNVPLKLSKVRARGMASVGHREQTVRGIIGF